MKKIRVIAAPSILGLRPSGVERLPDALIEAGLLQNLPAFDTIIDIPTLNQNFNSTRDPHTQCLNPETIRSFSKDLMNQIERQMRKPVFPLVLGGDCSILIGIMAGLKKTGKYGLIFLDAHADFYEPVQSPTGEVADMDLAIVTGRGPDILCDINNLKPYVADEHVIQIGQRDEEETRQYGSRDIRETAITVFDFPTIQSLGIDYVIDKVIEQMNKTTPDSFWIHFDTDVISDEENPAVDYRLPGGLTFFETSHLLRRLIKTEKIAGMSVTIFNPALDTSGKIRKKISKCLAFAFGEDSR